MLQPAAVKRVGRLIKKQENQLPDSKFTSDSRRSANLDLPELRFSAAIKSYTKRIQLKSSRWSERSHFFVFRQIDRLAMTLMKSRSM